LEFTVLQKDEKTDGKSLDKNKALKYNNLRAIFVTFCGEGGIRTLGTVARTTVFETATIDRSATSPLGAALRREQRDAKIAVLRQKIMNCDQIRRGLFGS
jgi:hypothetical protein